MENEVKKDQELKNLGEELKSVLASSKELMERHDKEKSENGQAIADTKEQVSKFVTEFGDKVDKYNAQVDKLKADMRSKYEAKANRSSFADSVMKSMDYDARIKEGNTRDMVGKSYKLNDASYFTKGADLTSDVATSAEAIISQTRDPQIYNEPQRALSMLDIIPVIPISGGELQLMVENYYGEVDSSPGREGKNGNAGSQASQLTDKNKAQFNFELKTYTPATIAQFIVVARQALQDVPQMRNHLNNRLPYAVRFEANRQILNGSGLNGQLEGINTVAPTVSIDPGTVIDQIRFAMGDLAEDDYPATHVVLNHADWTDIETLKDSDGRYIFGNPGESLSPRIWGLPVVPQNNQPAGTCLLGNFAMGTQLRSVIGSAELRISESHEDLFVKNGIVMLAEERLILGTQLPNAFRSFDFATS